MLNIFFIITFVLMFSFSEQGETQCYKSFNENTISQEKSENSSNGLCKTTFYGPTLERGAAESKLLSYSKNTCLKDAFGYFRICDSSWCNNENAIMCNFCDVKDNISCSDPWKKWSCSGYCITTYHPITRNIESKFPYENETLSENFRVCKGSLCNDDTDNSTVKYEETKCYFCNESAVFDRCSKAVEVRSQSGYCTKMETENGTYKDIFIKDESSANNVPVLGCRVEENHTHMCICEGHLCNKGTQMTVSSVYLSLAFVTFLHTT